MFDLKSKRESIWKEAKGICAHCGRKVYSERNKTLDHFIPKSCFGTYDYRNLFALCRRCNEERGNKLVGLDYYQYASEHKKMLAQQYGVEYNHRTASML